MKYGERRGGEREIVRRRKRERMNETKKKKG